eukprot:TRINITY_DN6552_c0_g3_i4.p1 TRINITY_DN6552_c0_g3~~TRINITY_DN6552_c0_g3_i4.p1  ORF type:complete len:862 (+),score=147.26 TRINITY_DN6552_c0_g3_i4:88-2586(+)
MYGSLQGQTGCLQCPAGNYSNLLEQISCPPCAKGTFTNVSGQTDCAQCSQGKYQDTVGQSQCTLCEVARYIATNKATTCSDCGVGLYGNVTGLSACIDCPKGKYQDLVRQSICKNCPAGYYSGPASETCSFCGVGRVAPNAGSEDCYACPSNAEANDIRTICQCPVGYYSNRTRQTDNFFTCVKCPTGASCVVSGVTWESMTTATGYWRSSTDSNVFYRCQFLALCEGGRNSTCASHRTGPVCSLCEEGYETFGSSCRACGNQTVSKAVFVIMIIVISLLVFGMYFAVLKMDKQTLRKMKKKMEVEAMIKEDKLDQDDILFFLQEDEVLDEPTIAGAPARPPNFVYKLKILLGFFQIAVGIAFAVEIPWPDTFKQFIALFNIANFDLVQWTRVGCVVKTNYFTKHLLVCLLPLIFFGVLVAFYLLPKFASRLTARGNHSPDSLGERQRRFRRGVRKFWKMVFFTMFLIYPSHAVEIPWPDTFKQFIALFNIANFDLVQWTRVGCVVKTNYFTKHLLVCLLPLIFFGVLVAFYLLPKFASRLTARGNPESLGERQRRFRRGVRKFWKMVFFTMFLIYPSVSSIIIRLYACTNVEGVLYLAADFTILCDSDEWRNRAFMNIPFVVLYPFGFLFLFSVLLYRKRHDLHQPEVMVSFGFLFGAYSNGRWWFELLDMAHKLVLTSIISLIPAAYALRVILIVLIFHTAVILISNPYLRKGDDRLHLLVQSVLFVMVLAGYVYTELVTVTSDIDNALSVIFIGMTIGVVGYVGMQVFKVARKYYIIYRRKKKGQRKSVGQGQITAGIHTGSTANLHLGSMQMTTTTTTTAVASSVVNQ